MTRRKSFDSQDVDAFWTLAESIVLGEASVMLFKAGESRAAKLVEEMRARYLKHHNETSKRGSP